MTVGPRRLARDFSNEFAQCDELEQTCDGSPHWNVLCDEWVTDVYKKLLSWKPDSARRFLSTSLFESSGGIHMIDESPDSNRKLAELRQRRDRLQLIVEPTKASWFVGLLRP
jgi:hypothetical protein